MLLYVSRSTWDSFSTCIRSPFWPDWALWALWACGIIQATLTGQIDYRNFQTITELNYRNFLTIIESQGQNFGLSTTVQFGLHLLCVQMSFMSVSLLAYLLLYNFSSLLFFWVPLYFDFSNTIGLIEESLTSMVAKYNWAFWFVSKDSLKLISRMLMVVMLVNLSNCDSIYLMFWI